MFKALGKLCFFIVRHGIGREGTTREFLGLDLIAEIGESFVCHVANICKNFAELGDVDSMVRMVE